MPCSIASLSRNECLHASTICARSTRSASARLVGIGGNSYLEGNLGYLKSRANADRLGGTARFVFPFRDRFAFTLEGGMNETLLSRDQTGRVVAGFQFGNFMRPKDYLRLQRCPACRSRRCTARPV